MGVIHQKIVSRPKLRRHWESESRLLGRHIGWHPKWRRAPSRRGDDTEKNSGPPGPRLRLHRISLWYLDNECQRTALALTVSFQTSSYCLVYRPLHRDFEPAKKPHRQKASDSTNFRYRHFGEIPHRCHTSRILETDFCMSSKGSTASF